MEIWILRQNLILRGTGKNNTCTHRYLQGPKEADSWCPMSTFPIDHSAGVQWHTAVFTVNKQMLHLWILLFSPATPYEKERNSASKHISKNHYQNTKKISIFLKNLFYHRKLQLLKISWLDIQSIYREYRVYTEYRVKQAWLFMSGCIYSIIE